LKKYIAYKKEQIESLKEQISELEEELEQLRNRDMELIVSISCEDISKEKETFPILNERVKSITDEPANYQKMVRLTKEEFEKLVKEVEPTISKTTFRGTTRKQSDLNIKIQCTIYGFCHFILACSLSNSGLDECNFWST
jgi:phage shock protein A